MEMFFLKLEAIAQSYKTIKDRRKNKVIGNFIVSLEEITQFETILNFYLNISISIS